MDWRKSFFLELLLFLIDSLKVFRVCDDGAIIFCIKRLNAFSFSHVHKVRIENILLLSIFLRDHN